MTKIDPDFRFHLESTNRSVGRSSVVWSVGDFVQATVCTAAAVLLMVLSSFSLPLRVKRSKSPRVPQSINTQIRADPNEHTGISAERTAKSPPLHFLSSFVGFLLVWNFSSHYAATASLPIITVLVCHVLPIMFALLALRVYGYVSPARMSCMYPYHKSLFPREDDAWMKINT